MPTKNTKATKATNQEENKINENITVADSKELNAPVKKTTKAKTDKVKSTKEEKPKAVKAKAEQTKAKTKAEPKTPKAKTLDLTEKKELEDIELKTIVEAMSDKKAQNICSIDLREMGTSICDYFVICNANSTTAVLAIADNIEEEMIVKCKTKVARKQGGENAFWIILDYTDIVVHIFQTEYREFYRLEELWADAKKIEYKEE